MLYFQLNTSSCIKYMFGDYREFINAPTLFHLLKISITVAI